MSKKPRGFNNDRFSYLRDLTAEFQNTDSLDDKKQVLANLANFAYDPYNYRYLRSLKVVELFLVTLEDAEEKLVEFAIGGICNLCLDPENKEIILRAGGVDKVLNCISSSNEETVISAITTLMYLVTPASKEEITSPVVIDCMLRLTTSANKRLANLANVFLKDYCPPHKIERTKHEFGYHLTTGQQ